MCPTYMHLVAERKMFFGAKLNMVKFFKKKKKEAITSQNCALHSFLILKGF